MMIERYPFLDTVEILILVVWAIAMLAMLTVHYVVIRRERKMIQKAELNIADEIKDFEMICDLYEKIVEKCPLKTTKTPLIP